jgi:hypothetical protein
MKQVDPKKVIKVKPKMIKENFNNMKHPDPKKHQQISFAKSILRILGYALLFINIPTAACILITSEILGIYEELV